MAGAACSITRSTRQIGGSRKKEVLLWLEFTSDDTTGLCPAQDLLNLNNYVVTEVTPYPDAVAPPTAAYEVRIEDSNDVQAFLSGSIAVDGVDPIGAHVGTTTGNYPRMDAEMVIKIVDPADHATLLNIGNSKTTTILLRLEEK